MVHKVKTIGGTWYIMPTTFDEDGNLDLESQVSLTNAVIQWGVDGITLLGVMGEASALTMEERTKILKAVVTATAGRVPIAVGCSSNAPYAVGELCTQAQDLGEEFAMVSAPQLLRDADAMPGFYTRVKERSDIPLILQDEPAATGVLVPSSIWAKCLQDSGSQYLKLEDPPTASKISALLKIAPETRIFGGLGGAASYYEMSRGAIGTMTGFTYPEILASIRVDLESGKKEVALKTFANYLPLILFEAQLVIGLGIRKELLKRRGVIKSGTTRIGAARPAPQILTELDDVLKVVGITPSSASFEVRA
jgi:4-hydroxy-tetrahydrodipicolinate synthase